jgi:hypothetical protein
MENEQENELIGIYEGLIPENREIFLQNARVMRLTEQSVKRHYGIPDWEPPKQAGKTA